MDYLWCVSWARSNVRGHDRLWCRAKANSSNCSLFKWAVTAVCLCSAVWISLLAQMQHSHAKLSSVFKATQVFWWFHRTLEKKIVSHKISNKLYQPAITNMVITKYLTDSRRRISWYHSFVFLGRNKYDVSCPLYETILNFGATSRSNRKYSHIDVFIIGSNFLCEGNY